MHFSSVYKQECIPVGCLSSAAVGVCWGEGSLPGGGVSAQEGVAAQGMSAWGVSAFGAVCLGGVCPGVSALGVSGRQPPTDRILTHACENITFPQLHLWTVIISLNQFHLSFKSHETSYHYFLL